MRQGREQPLAFHPAGPGKNCTAMDHEEILTPVDLYKTRLKKEHAQNTAIYFENLVKKSGVDEASNQKLVGQIRQLENKNADISSKLKKWKSLRVIMYIFIITGAIFDILWLISVLWENFHFSFLTAAAGTAALVLALFSLKPINNKISIFSEYLEKLTEDLRGKMDTAWQMMEPLNRLYRWDSVANVVMKTLPILFIDRYVSKKRLEQLQNYFGWSGRSDETSSVLACQSGVVNGNPWVVVEKINQTWGMKTYTGSLTISWQEWVTETDSDGNTSGHWETRTQTLNASVNKPVPVYGNSKSLIYGNEAAPELNFSRKPNPICMGARSGKPNSIRLKMAIAALEKRSRDMSNTFIIMDNQEFDACFNAVNRDNEQQFRLLFTPLAQQEMLKLLLDQEQGYGDDFTFIKQRMINVVESSHLDAFKISASPQDFRNYDLAGARKNFCDYSNEFFRCFFFSFAPFFSIPLYQQHRNFPDIYQGVIKEGEVSFCEHEFLANAVADERFFPSEACTQSILKTRISAGSGNDTVLTVTAHAFKTVDRVDYVSVMGGDGRIHEVPVNWEEYLPVSQDSQMAVCAAGTGDHLEFDQKKNTPEWQRRLMELGADGTSGRFLRGLAAFVLPR